LAYLGLKVPLALNECTEVKLDIHNTNCSTVFRLPTQTMKVAEKDGLNCTKQLQYDQQSLSSVHNNNTTSTDNCNDINVYAK